MNGKLVAQFTHIRDIPYRIQLTADEPDLSCTGKNGQLKALLEQDGIQVRWRVCKFKWSDISAIPPEVTSASHSDDCTHAYLEALIDGKWLKIDATWDKPLARILPVAEWDGISDTKLAVPCRETLSPEESADIVAGENREVIETDLKINGEFYAAFNDWLARERG